MIEQSPFPGEKPIVKKVLVVCPVTLIDVTPVPESADTRTGKTNSVNG